MKKLFIYRSLRTFLVSLMFISAFGSAQAQTIKAGDVIYLYPDWYGVHVVSTDPLIIGVWLYQFHSNNDAMERLTLTAVIDGSSYLLLDYNNPTATGAQWHTYTPSSTLTFFDANGSAHNYYLQIPAGKNIKFISDGRWTTRCGYGCEIGKDDIYDFEKTVSYAAPDAPEIEVTASCSGNEISWGEVSAEGIAVDYTSYKVYYDGASTGSVTRSGTSWTHSTGSRTSYKVKAVVYPEYENTFDKVYWKDYIGDYFIGENFDEVHPVYSSYSATKSAIPLKPATPQNLSASTDLCTDVKVEWTLEGTADYAKIYRSANNSTWEEVGEVGGMFRSFLDAPPIEGTNYYYQVKAFKEGCVSDVSSSITGRSYGEPTAPGSFTAQAQTNSIKLTWSNSSRESGYTLKRSSSSGSAEFSIGENETSYIDNSLNGCEKYTYELYAVNKCTSENGSAGVAAPNQPTAKLSPVLTSYLTKVDASKAYYPDKVLVSWTVQEDNINLVDGFDVSRSIAGENNFEMLGTVRGGSSYEDMTAVGGLLYEYRVSAYLDCGGDMMESNTRTTTGFRLPYGVITGRLEYEDGMAVQDAEVLVEKTSGLTYGHSLLFDGSSSVSITNADELNPESFMVAEAWIRPSTLTGSGDIFQKQSGTSGYRLYREGNDVKFQINVGGGAKTVTASDVLQLNAWTHVAGSYDSTGVKIYIDGEIPGVTTYRLTAGDLDNLSAMGIDEEIISKLRNLRDVVYTSYPELETAVLGQIGSIQQERNMPLITPLAKKFEYLPGTNLEANGSIQHSSGSLTIGSGFSGNMDEIRIWNISKDEDNIKYNYKRIVGNDETGIAGYWRCDENFGTQIYDASKSGGLYHKNDGFFSGDVIFDGNIPNNSQLGWIGVADENGDYMIPYIPYMGTGENFKLTPRYETHEFNPGSKTRFIGEGSAILDGQDFTDVSSFKVTGTVFYEGTTCGVEGCLVGVDGSPLVKDGLPVYTDQYGEFSVNVPVGNHYLYIQKYGHDFESYKFPPGPAENKFNFQEDIVGINFIDQTKQKIVGRVVGGTVQGDKAIGMGLSKNNVGVASFDFVSATGPGCSSYHVTTDSLSGEYIVYLPPMKYNVRNFEVPKNPVVTQYFSELEVGDFSQVTPDQPSVYEYPTRSLARIKMNKLTETVSLFVEEENKNYDLPLEVINAGGTAERGRFVFLDENYEYKLDPTLDVKVINDSVNIEARYDTAYYNFRYDFIYRSQPTISVTAGDGESWFQGETTVNYKDPITGRNRPVNIEDHPFQYPVLIQGRNYEMIAHLEEIYYNQDVCPGVNGCEEATEDRVAVNDGELIIQNQLAVVEEPAPIAIRDGQAKYTFKGGYPVLRLDANFPWRDFSGTINITAELDGRGYDWEPFNTSSPETMPFMYEHDNFPHPDDKYFRAYLLGSKEINGSDFVTNGPQVVKYILRDPPGSESYSFLEKGSSFTSNYTIHAGLGQETDLGVRMSLGGTQKLAIGVGTATIIETAAKADFEIGATFTSGDDDERGFEETITTTETWSTSASPEMAGAPSDLFIGNSLNFNLSIADMLTVTPMQIAETTGMTAGGGNPAGADTNQFVLTLNKELCASPSGYDTWFIYSADHIENYLIPNIIRLRNSLFLQDTAYVSKLSADHDMFGSNNDDPRWKDYGQEPTSSTPWETGTEDYDGPSYLFKYVRNSDRDQTDMVRKYNEQIRLWEEALERNEREKANAELVRNISFTAGSTTEYSQAVETSQSYTHTFEFEANPRVLNENGFEINDIGFETSLSLTGSFTHGHSYGNTETSSTTYGYVLSDPDYGDYYSVDVKDPKTGSGPVFAVKAGRSMCPHEGPELPKYYTPAKYTINYEVYDSLKLLGLSRDLMTIFSFCPDYLAKSGNLKGTCYWPETGNFDNLDVNNSYYLYTMTEEMKDMYLDNDFRVKPPQVFNREFRNSQDFVKAVTSHINLKFPPEAREQVIRLVADDVNVGEYLDPERDDFTCYLRRNSRRLELLAEFNTYMDYILEITKVEDSERKQMPISEGTIRREVPVASITPGIQYNIPDDNTAYFTLQLGNESYTEEGMGYELAVLEHTNPDGAVIKIDGDNVNQTFSIDAASTINKTVSVKMGKPDVYDYEDIQMIFYSGCDYEFADAGAELAEESVDTVSFSVHFVPSCTNVELVRPKNQFIINAEDEHLVDGVKETKVPVLMSGYDVNNSLFEKLNFQYKSSAEPEWTRTTDFYVTAAQDDHKEIPGKYTAVEWDLSGFPDGEYNLRAKTYCGYMPDGTEMFDLSEVWTGVVDRKPPQVFGTPQPADGILSPDDDIVIEFNEEIYGGKLSKLANFDIRGILNGTDLRHDVSVSFYDNTEDFVRIPEGINLVGKSFTIEFWMQTQRAYQNECIFSQNTDPQNMIQIMLTGSGNIDFQVGDQIYTEDHINMADLVQEWHHWAFIYDNVRAEAIIMMDGVPLSTGPLNPVYTGYGDAYIGKAMAGDRYPFKGSVHELRIWERPRTASAITANMLITLSGKETGLIGYWPFNDAYGNLATEKVHRRNATVSAPWNISPNGYAASFDSQMESKLDMNFSDIAFAEEEDFTIEFWFKSSQGSNTCLLSNGFGDENDNVLYYYSPYDLALTANVLPLEENVQQKLSSMINDIYANGEDFLDEVEMKLGQGTADRYREQLLRFGKHMPTYWSINTDAAGNLQVNNNGKRIKTEGEDFFDDRWHHFALVVQRVGNTRIYLDGELKVSQPSTEWNGFGAARLFVGARGLFNQSLPGYEFDQYFTGSIDELRIWNTAIKQTQIERNSTMRLDGDELGLVAYFPFETYEEVMGVPVIAGTILDDMTHDSVRNVTDNNAVLVQDNNVPNVRMKRPSSQVDFSFVAQEDRVAFVLNEPNAKIENCILDITARNVEDMHSNKMSSPVTWSAYIDRNQVKWGDQQFDLEKELYASMSFTTKIVNYSGQQQFYTLENLPGWLSVEPREGTLEPLSEQNVTFMVSEGVNVGTYSKDISLKTDFGFDEKLQVGLRVYEPLPPDWKVTPNDYEFSMNIIGYVSINGVISADPYDKVAAFVDGECRGIANLKYVEEYDMYQVYLDVYSNKAWNEYFELHIWDAGSGREFRGVSAEGLEEAPAEYANQYEFIDNNIYGSPSSPVPLRTSDLTIQKIPLHAGWNWNSFNLEMDRGKTLSQLLEGCRFTEGDLIKGFTKYSEFYDVWIGSLNFLESGTMYMIKSDKADTLKVSGVPVNPLDKPIPVLRGWNWIGYTPSVNIAIDDALGLFNPGNGDLIKSQFAFSMYDPLMGWVGTIDYLRPSYGYKYKYVESSENPSEQDLYFPPTGTRLKSATAEQEAVDTSYYSAFSNNMSVVAKVEGVEAQKPGDRVLAYHNEVLRGEVSPIEVDGDKLIYFITLFGNNSRDEMDFVYVTADGESYRVHEKLPFVGDSLVGSLSEPFVLTVDQEATGWGPDGLHSLKTWPNPFNDILKVSMDKSGNEDVELALIDGLGKVVKIEKIPAGKQLRAEFKTQGVNPGVYLLRVKTGKKTVYRKVIKVQ